MPAIIRRPPKNGRKHLSADPLYKLLRQSFEQFKFLDKYYLVNMDGTRYFTSEKIHCPSCLKKEHKDGRVTYSHQMLAAVLAHPCGWQMAGIRRPQRELLFANPSAHPAFRADEPILWTPPDRGWRSSARLW